MRGWIRTVVLATAVVGAAITLSGCGQRFGPPVDSPSAHSVPSPTPSSTVAGASGNGTPIAYSCDELIDPDVIDQLDARADVDSSYVPSATTSAERAVAIGGTACRWIDAHTGTSVIVSVAHPDAETLAALRTATASYATPTTAFGTFGLQGYRANIQMEAYTDSGFWVTASSPLFTDLGKARLIMEAAIESLPS